MKKILIMILALGILTLTTNAQRYTPIVNSSFIVGAGHVKYWNFSNLNCTTVFGEFRAEGGTSNDIQVVIMQDFDVDNWVNGHTVTTYYNSGSKTAGKFSVNITDKANFSVVFSNTGGFTQRAVTATVLRQPCGN